MSQAGDFSEPILIERHTSGADGIGGSTYNWAPLATHWAKIVPDTGREREIAGRQDTAPSYRVTIRCPIDITAEDRIVWNGDIFAIDDLVPALARAPEQNFHITKTAP